MKKILLLTENFPPIEGGSGRWFWELYSRLPKKNVIILTHDIPGGDNFDVTHDLNVTRTFMSSKEWGIRSKTGIKFYWRMLFEVRKLVKAHNIDEIHCGRVIHEGVIALLAKKLFGVPFLCFVHGEDVETAATSREQAWLVKRVCKDARVLICNSFNSQRLVKELGFAPTEKCEVIHPGVDVSRFFPAPPDHAFLQNMGWAGKTVMLTVGRLQQRKGQDYLIRAMPELLKTKPNLFYAIVGRGECESALRNSVSELGLDSYVKIYTDLDDDTLIKCYQQCDCFVLPNRTIENDIEGFGMVLVEAQACGKPVVAGNSGGTVETMIQGETGLIIDCSAPGILAKELAPILSEDDFWHYGNSGMEHVHQSLNWETHVKRAKKILFE